MPVKAQEVRQWYEQNEREIVLAVLVFTGGFLWGRVAGRHEK